MRCCFFAWAIEKIICGDIQPVADGLLFEAVPTDWRRQMAAIAAVSLHCDASGVSDEVLAEAAVAGVPVLCYTVNDAAAAAPLFARGVSSLFTDRLDLFG